MRTFRILAGLLVGCTAFVILNLILISLGGFTFDLQAASRTAAENVIRLAVFLVWAAAVLGAAALVGRISGRLEVPVAVAAAILATTILVKVGTNSSPTSILSDALLPNTMLSLPLLTLSAVGASLVFFARRQDLR